ncbi:6890_t:CDS:2, partial [Funneliformis geosporum]
TPGQRLGFAQDYAAGSGTYVRGNLLYASVVGVKRILKTTAEGEAILTVSREKKQSAIPEEYSIVTGKVIRITPKEAVVSIMVVGNSPCKEDFQGIIRQRDVRATEKDKVKIHDSFRPGDIIRAEVISLGDARSYYLSTAKNELGVIYAQSVEGAAMIPISWQEMQCTKTNTKELRKCAKPF